MEATSDVRSATFGPVPGSVAAARRFLRHELELLDVPEPPMEATVLLTSELVSNAILHARTDVELRLVSVRDHVRVEVADGNSRLPSTALAPADATSGRGLLLVQALAGSWGVEGTLDGKVVWFELPVARLA